MEENKVMNIELTPEMFEKLDDSKKNSEKIAYESKTYIADAWNRFKKNKLALIGLCFLLVMAIGCIFVPIFSSYTYDGQNMANTFAGPSMDHIFGTDRFGRDVLVRIMSVSYTHLDVYTRQVFTRV